SDGVTPVQGLNVIARRVGDEATTAVSVVSGSRYKSNVGLGSRDPQLWGFYEIRGLPPGTYRVGVEPFLDTPPVSPRPTAFADPAEGGSLSQPLSGGREDPIQDWYRFTLTEPSLVTAILTTAASGADLNLYLFGANATGSDPRVLARSVDPLAPPETVQLRLP